MDEIITLVEQARVVRLGAGIGEAVAHVEPGRVASALTVAGMGTDRFRDLGGADGNDPGWADARCPLV